MVDELYKKHGMYWYKNGYNIVAIISWLTGFVIYEYASIAGVITGGTVPSFLAAGIIYLILSKAINKSLVMKIYNDLKHLSIQPFINNKNKVFIANGKGPYENTVAALKNIDLTPVKGRKVLLKPNAGRMATSDKGITTHPEVVAAAIDVFRKYGAEVAIGESPISGVKTHEAFEITGIKKVADERNCPLIDMDERKFVNVSIPEGIALKSMKVCPEIFEFDIIVSIPVMKTHMHTGATLAIKNMKGCLWRRSKVKLHMLPPVENREDKPIDIAISDMSTLLKPHLSIIEGTVSMQGMGAKRRQSMSDGFSTCKHRFCGR